MSGDGASGTAGAIGADAEGAEEADDGDVTDGEGTDAEGDAPTSCGRSERRLGPVESTNHAPAATSSAIAVQNQRISGGLRGAARGSRG
jgi:hypothetical protein